MAVIKGFFFAQNHMKKPSCASSMLQVAKLESEGRTVGTWLMPMLDEDGKWGLGCWTCKEAGLVTAWAEGRVLTSSLGNVRRHGDSKQHRESTAKCGLDGDDADMTMAAPSLESFRSVLHHRQEGRPLRSKLDSMGSWKIGKMTFCLAEAAREKAREALRSAESIAMKVDSREGMLLVRYTACNSNLDVSTGLLGHKFVNERETASAIVQCLRGMVTSFATSNIDGVLEQALVDHIHQKVEVFCADKASNEQLLAVWRRPTCSAMPKLSTATAPMPCRGWRFKCGVGRVGC